MPGSGNQVGDGGTPVLPSQGEGDSAAARPPPLPTPDDIARLLAVAQAAQAFLDAPCESELYFRGRLQAAMRRLHSE